MHQHQEASTKGLLGKLCSGEKKLAGKVFYLDNLKKRPAALLVEAIYFQGGRVESFLHNGVSFVVTGNRDVLNVAKKESEEAKGPVVQEDNILIKDKQQPRHSKLKACGSRGRALLEKAIRNNNERLGSSILANAKAWGVEILFVDAVLLYLKHLNKDTQRKQKKTDNPAVKGQFTIAIALRSPFIKIEDVSRKYKPLHVQAMNFPILHFSNRFSPFESPSRVLVKQAEKAPVKNRERSHAESGATVEDSHSALSPSPWHYRKRDHSFCECCHQPFSNFEEHLQSGQHRAFVQDSSNYSLVDQLVSQMLPGFSLISLLSVSDRHSAPSPIPYMDELLPLTDADGANVGSLSSNPRWMAASGSPAASDQVGPYPIPDVETPPAKLSSLCHVQVKEPDISSSMVIMEKNLEFNHHDPESQQTQQLDLFPSCDPYSQPPVLSPQIPNSDEFLEPHCLYSEPPALSPQCYSTVGACKVDSYLDSLPQSNLENPSLQKVDFWPSNNSDRTTKKRHISTPKHVQCKRRRTTTTSGGGLPEGADEILSGKSNVDIACKSHLSPSLFFEHCAAQICPQKQEQSNISRLSKVQPVWLGPYIQLFNEPLACQDTKPSQSTSFCIDSTLIPDVGKLVSSSDSDWDCELLPQLESTAAPGHRNLNLQNCELDKDVLQRPHAWMHDSTYESRLHTVLQPEKSAATLLNNASSRALVQIVEVQH
ncbi:uncharacterized protein dbf4b isoform X2 [Synchiropus splendidus]|uniref:uncharacterized protein dbf4b isoform X2 n=1 Tax=Synchiropus splendidus TaxID=270530 RepID=UPI00237E4699|nr:uncharacterized protein dbf4b isoform X2 [Synchiropus splendidus]